MHALVPIHTINFVPENYTQRMILSASEVMINPINSTLLPLALIKTASRQADADFHVELTQPSTSQGTS